MIMTSKSSLTLSLVFAFALAKVSALPISIRPIIGGCNSTEYGCCYDNITPCSNSTCLNCPKFPHEAKLGGCISTEFGCCSDGVRPCSSVKCTNCNITHATGTTLVNKTIANFTSHLIGGCGGTKYGCCRDNATACTDKPCSNCYEVM